MLTVLEWEPVVHEADGFFTTTATTYRDNSWKGSVLEVKAVQLPYVVVNNHSYCSGRAITLDTRQVKLMELSPSMVEAMIGRVIP